MTPPDRPAPQPAPDLDAGQLDEIVAALGRIGLNLTARAITSLRERVASDGMKLRLAAEAIDHNAALAKASEKRVAELEAALRPLAEKFLSPDDIDKDMPPGARMSDDEDYDAAANDEQVDDVWIKRGDIRRARAALNGGTT